MHVRQLISMLLFSRHAPTPALCQFPNMTLANNTTLMAVCVTSSWCLLCLSQFVHRAQTRPSPEEVCCVPVWRRRIGIWGEELLYAEPAGDLDFDDVHHDDRPRLDQGGVGKTFRRDVDVSTTERRGRRHEGHALAQNLVPQAVRKGVVEYGNFKYCYLRASSVTKPLFPWLEYTFGVRVAINT